MAPAAPSPLASAPATPLRVVVMGVAGCGKSAVGELVAQRLGLPLVEGDDFHPPENIRKMAQGMALTDADRDGWLHVLAQELARRPQGVVLTCSALKAGYRGILRAAATPLYFVHLAITPAESLRRVRERSGHFYPPSLVASQFEALEDPLHENGVLTLPGDAPPHELAASAVRWLRSAVRGGLSAGP
ncbi:MAG: gluconokinase [Polaromonas sp.]|nr:gluconokinase [Polaromonas sp.]